MLPEDIATKETLQISTRRNVPKLPGQDTSQYRDYTSEMQESRKTLMLEVANEDIPTLTKLMEFAKEKKMFEPIWGTWAHATEPLTYESPRGDISRLVHWAQNHTNYGCSMTSTELEGIVDINAKAPIMDSGLIVGHLSFREVCYKYLKTPDGASLIAELHQCGPMGKVEAIHPNTPGAKKLIANMNKHMGGFVRHYFPGVGVPYDFTMELMRNAIEPKLLHSAAQCSWNMARSELTTPEDHSAANNLRTSPFSRMLLVRC